MRIHSPRQVTFKPALLLVLTFCWTGMLHAQSNADTNQAAASIASQDDPQTGIQPNLDSVLVLFRAQQDEALKSMRADLERLSVAFESRFNKQNVEIKRLKSKVRLSDKKNTALNDSILVLRENLSLGLTNVDSGVHRLDADLIKANSDLSSVREQGVKSDETAQKRFNYFLIALAVTLILVAFSYWYSKKNQDSVQAKIGKAEADMNRQVSELHAEIAEKMADTLEKFVQTDSEPSQQPEETKRLILDMAAQVVFLENNIWQLPENDRMRKRVERSAKKIRETFSSMGYEMTYLLGTEVSKNQNIDVDPNKEEDENIPEGKEIISQVMKAEILFKNRQITRPSVRVKINPKNS